MPPQPEASKRKGSGLSPTEGFRFVANIELQPFVRTHPFETVNFLTNAVVKHYQDELLSQAALIQIIDAGANNIARAVKMKVIDNTDNENSSP